MTRSGTDWLVRRAQVDRANKSTRAGGEQPMTTTTPEPTITDTNGRIPWSGLLVPYGVKTGDDRLVKALMSRETPLHLFWQPQDAPEHDGKITVGAITEAHSSPAGMYGSGYLLNPDEVYGHVADAVRNAIAFMDEGLGQVSGDIVNAVAHMDGDTLVVESGELAGATLVGVPAFADSRIAVEAADTLTVTFSASDLHLDTGADMAFVVTGSADLPLADPSRGWDGNRARRRMVDAARGEDDTVNVRQASRGFFWRDGDGQNYEDYKLPFSDIVNGRLTAVPAGLSAVLSFLGRTDGPSASQKETIRRKVAAYQRRLDNGDGEGRGTDTDDPSGGESNMANNDDDGCPEGQHRMPDGECMDDEDMAADGITLSAGVHLRVGPGLVLSRAADSTYEIRLADADEDESPSDGESADYSSNSSETAETLAALERELTFGDLAQQMNGKA